MIDKPRPYPRFVVCKASAGSGKTFTLVREYLRLAFDVPESEWTRQYRRILAVTFTNKAANEMKERVLFHLESMAAQGNGCTMGAELCRLLDWDDATLRRAAQTLRTDILHHYSDFSISTIDRFMTRLVRTFARELNLPMGFDVLTDSRELVEASVDALLDMAGTEGEEDLSEVLFEFVQTNMEDDKGYKIAREIRSLAKEIFSEEAVDCLKQIDRMSLSDFLQLHRRYREENARFLNELSAKGKEVLQLLESNGIQAEYLYRGASGVAGWFRKCARGEVAWPPSSYVVDFFDNGKHYGGKCPDAARRVIDTLFPQMEEAYRTIGRRVEQEQPRYNTRKVLLKRLFPLALINRVSQLVEEQYGEQEAVHISAFNKKIYQVVQDEPMPFVYERIGSRYNCFLIDEFQDTSRMQWQNLLPLVDDSVSSGGCSLVVGDAKQAIYRFRQGDVEQFVALPHVDSRMHGIQLQQPGVSEIVRLKNNFRSAEEIVTFNNRFYRWLVEGTMSHNEMLRRIYLGSNGVVEGDKAELEQQSIRTGGYVSLDFWDADTLKASDSNLLHQRVYDIIVEQVEQRGFSYRDITLLARDNVTLKEVASFLAAHADGRRPVPMVSSDSFAIDGSLAVRLLRSALLWVFDDRDELAALQMLEYMRRLSLLNCDYEQTLMDEGVAHVAEMLEREGFQIHRERLRNMALYECCETLVRELHLFDSDPDYVISFLGRVHTYACRNRSHIGEFVEWLDEQHFSLTTTDSIDAVKLSTIHRAKGLEAPVVIYLMPRRQENKNKTLWVTLDDKTLGLPVGQVSASTPQGGAMYDAQVEEERLHTEVDNMNLLYVATTRPREKLFLVCALPARADDAPFASWFCQYGHDYLTAADPSALQANGAPTFRYTAGTDGRAPQREREASQPPTMHPTLHFAPWEEKVVVALSPESRTVDRDDARRYGVAMHEVLSQATDISDVSVLVDGYCGSHEVADEWPQRLREEVEKLLSQPAIVPFFDHTRPMHNECEMLYNGQLLRPDRVIYRPDGEVWVVDFKTGSPDPHHAEQLDGYRKALVRMGYARVRAFLLYTATATVVEQHG